jgi:hypothetical protein
MHHAAPGSDMQRRSMRCRVDAMSMRCRDAPVGARRLGFGAFRGSITMQGRPAGRWIGTMR